MRISDNTFGTNFLTNVNLNKSRIDRLQLQLASGKKFSKPSEQPIDAAEVIHIRELQDRNEQYSSNILSATDYLTATSNAVEQTASVFEDAIVSMTKAAGPANLRDLPTYAQELDGLIRKLVSISNSSFDGKLLFAGTKTKSTVDNPVPFVQSETDIDLSENYTVKRIETVEINSDSSNGGEILIPIGEGISSRMNLPGSVLFGSTENTDSPQAFQALIDARDLLDNTYTEYIDSGEDHTIDTSGFIDSFNEQMSILKQTLDYIRSQNERIGSDLESLDAVKSRLEDDKISLENMRALREDTDVASAVVELQKQQNQLEAAYKTGANVLPKSLVDFLR